MEKIGPYQKVLDNHEERGLLAYSEKEWFEAIEKLILSPELRKKMGENAYNYVKENHTIQKNSKVYVDFFKKVFDSPFKRM